MGKNLEPKNLEEIKVQKGGEVSNDITEMVFILDKSGSMAGMESDTIGGFNSMIEKQKNEEGCAYVSTILFSTQSTLLHDRKDLRDIELLQLSDYVPSGCTALLDAIGYAIGHVENIHKYARHEDVPSKTIFVITTDGKENASRKYTYEKIKQMIEEKKEKCGWEFLFVAANIDVVQVAESIGIRSERSASYDVKEDTKEFYMAMSDSVSLYRKEGSLPSGWNVDFENRLNERKKSKSHLKATTQECEKSQ